jgi:molybdate transport system substrate-binding protein
MTAVLRLLALAALAGRLVAADLTVFAAASLSDALQEIGRNYQAGGGDPVHFNLAASSTLARQIKEGAPADVFFSADEAKMDELEKAGLLAAGSRRRLLSNTLVIVAPKAATVPAGGAAFLLLPAVRRLALAETTTVPAGIYARAWLEKTGLWPKVAAKVIATENVRACLAAVESGNVDAGIVYRTDALLSRQVQVVDQIPAAEGPRISYPAAVLRATKQPEAAARFADYLASPAAQAVFLKFGFTTAP